MVTLAKQNEDTRDGNNGNYCKALEIKDRGEWPATVIYIYISKRETKFRNDCKKKKSWKLLMNKGNR